MERAHLSNDFIYIRFFSSVSYVLESFRWMVPHEDQVTLWNINPSCFYLAALKGHHSSQSGDKKEQTTKVRSKSSHVGGRLAWNTGLCGRRYGCDHEIVEQCFPPRKKGSMKWHKCWLALLNHRKLNWLLLCVGFFFFPFENAANCRGYIPLLFSAFWC